MDPVDQHDGDSNMDSPTGNYEITDKIENQKAQIENCGKLLKDICTNEERFAFNCNKKQEIEGILANPEKRSYITQCPINDIRLREDLVILERQLEQNILTLQMIMQQLQQTMSCNLNLLTSLKCQIVNDKLKVWKHEQQQIANGISKAHSISLDTLQVWCEELSDLIWRSYVQLTEAERVLQNREIQTENALDLTFVQRHTKEAVKLLEDVLNHCLIVEVQPPQIIRLPKKFVNRIVVSLLVGNRLNIHMNPPSLSTTIIREEQARNFDITNQVEASGEIAKGSSLMDCREDKTRLSATFKYMMVKTIKRAVRSERVMQEKYCLQFTCLVTVGPLKFRVSTISLPMMEISNRYQEAIALATISWDYALGEIGRVPFEVRTTATWPEVAQILNAKFVKVAKRGLTEDNLACLAQKAFRNQRPQPETITWPELCKDNLPGRDFTFWTWFHAALKLIERKETHLKDLWSKGFIMGFIERETAEDLISHCVPGTFLLRFADSIPGAITITLLATSGTVMSLRPFQTYDLQYQRLAISIKQLSNLKYLYQLPQPVHKNEAFGNLYNERIEQALGAKAIVSSPYKNIVLSIQNGDDDDTVGDNIPIPAYDDSCNN